MSTALAELGPAWLFCPADRPDRYAKAAERADAVIVDLEDGVGPANRLLARRALVDTPLSPSTTIVRVNPVDTRDFLEDMAALADTDYRMVMLAKTEAPDDVAPLTGFEVVALCETPLGVMRGAEIALAKNVGALMWGAEDLIAAIGGSSSRFAEGAYRDVARYARCNALLAGAVTDKPVVDAVFLNIADVDGLAAEAADGAAQGFRYKACIHPRQVDFVRRAYRPSAERIAWATRVLATAESNPGAFALEGQMIDEPVLRHARRLMQNATS